MLFDSVKKAGAASCCSSIRRIICIAAFTVLVVCAACSLSYADERWNGAGTKAQPFEIADYDDLLELSTAVKGGEDFDGQYFSLKADISLKDGWEPVGALAEGTVAPANGLNIRPFSGTFDGGGFTVTSADGGRSLFGYLRGATVKDLCVAGTDIKGCGLISYYTKDLGSDGKGTAVHTATIDGVTIKTGTSIENAGIVNGFASSDNIVDISNCTVESGVVIGSGKNIGKIGSFGGDFNGTVTGCKSAATVYGTEYVGGIIGCKGQALGAADISGCTFSGEVIASGSYAGGMAGGGYGGTGWGIETAPNGGMINIQSCHSSGRITAADIAGGILGYETTVQPWANAYIQSNLFTGQVTVTGGTSAGAIVGAFRGMDKCSIIRDNYYAAGCGTNRGIGKVQYLDTSCATHETQYGENYFDTSSGNIPKYPGLNDKYDNLLPNYNRTDDPLGADADKVAKAVTAEALKDGSVKELLNSAAGSLKNWIQAEKTPVIEGQGVEPYEPTEEEKEKAAHTEAVREASALLIKVEDFDENEALYTKESYDAFFKAEEILLGLMTNESSKAADIRAAMDALEKAAEALVKRDVQPMTIKVSGAKKYKVSALKKKAKTFKAYTVKNAKGALTYKVTGAAKSRKVLKLNKKTGKVTVKKGAKKGTYTLKVKITADGGTTYLAGSKTVTIKVKVK